jgi:hypothetical protein
MLPRPIHKPFGRLIQYLTGLSCRTSFKTNPTASSEVTVLTLHFIFVLVRIAMKKSLTSNIMIVDRSSYNGNYFHKS